MIANTPGTIDCGYLNQIFIAMRNLSQQDTLIINDGDKLAQFKMQKLLDYEIVQIGIQQYSTIKTERGLGGFGSSDNKK